MHRHADRKEFSTRGNKELCCGISVPPVMAHKWWIVLSRVSRGPRKDEIDRNWQDGSRRIELKRVWDLCPPPLSRIYSLIDISLLSASWKFLFPEGYCTLSNFFPRRLCAKFFKIVASYSAFSLSFLFRKKSCFLLRKWLRFLPEFKSNEKLIIIITVFNSVKVLYYKTDG